MSSSTANQPGPPAALDIFEDMPETGTFTITDEVAINETERQLVLNLGPQHPSTWRAAGVAQARG